MEAFLTALKDYLGVLSSFCFLILWGASVKSSQKETDKEVKELKVRLSNLETKSLIKPEDCLASRNSCKAVYDLKNEHMVERLDNLEALLKANKIEVSEALNGMEERLTSALNSNLDERTQMLRAITGLTDEIKVERLTRAPDRGSKKVR